MSVEAKGLDETLTFLRGLPRQVRFALAGALNDTARDVQRFTVQDLLPDKFTLRARGAPWWRPGTRFGFNIRFASRSRLESTIGSRADWLDLQERGGTKRAAGGRLAITQPEVRDTPTSVIPGRRKPRRLLARGKAFKLRSAKGEGVYERLDEDRLQLLYLLRPSAQIPARLDFVDSARDRADTTLGPNMTRHLVAAIAGRAVDQL